MGNVNPRVDLAFKKIFGVEENKDLTIALINSIVSKEDQVHEITLLNPYNPKNFKGDKLSILDIKAKGHDGKRFNIEIQISDEADYDKRALYYWGKLYTEQLKESEDYSNLSKAIGIHILNFTSIPESEKYHNVFHITEKETGLLYFKDLELHTVELKKFVNYTNEKQSGADTTKNRHLETDLADLILKVKTSLDMWVAFLTKYDLLNKDNLPKELEDEKLKKALTVLEVMNFNDEEKEAYEDHLKWLRIETNTLKNYEQKGIDKGIEIGEQIGIEKGKAERNHEIAIDMISMNMDDELILKCSRLTLQELAALKTFLSTKAD
jgi:predicted transposase/invertase (TIGR01784 family)